MGYDVDMAVQTPRRMSREARREALIDAAKRVLRRHSLADLSFELVADEAGVSKTLPYSYFDSPAEIAVALYRQVVGRVDTATDEIVASDRSFDDKLRATLDLWCDEIEADGRMIRSLLDGHAVAAVRPLIEARDSHAVEVWATALHDEFDLDDRDATFVAHIVSSGTTAALQQWAAEGHDRRIVIERLVRATRAMALEFATR